MNMPASMTITPIRVADLLAGGERMPVYAHVIDHPDARVLVDTGMTELHPAVADLDPRLNPLPYAPGRAGRHPARRRGFTDGQATFGHVDVAYLPLPTWQPIASGHAQPGAPTQAQIDALGFPSASVVALPESCLVRPEGLARRTGPAETHAAVMRPS